MSNKIRLSEWKDNLPLQITIKYILIALTLLFVSEYVFSHPILSAYDPTSKRMIQGFVLILVTSIIMYHLLKLSFEEKQSTDRKLRESEKRLRALIDTMPDFVSLRDQNGHWIEANKAMLKLFKFKDPDFTGKSNSEMAELSPLYKSIVEQCSRSDQHTIETGKQQTFEETFTLPDQSDCVYEVTKVPIEYEPNNIGLLIIGKDITERKRVEEELRMTKEQMESFFNNTTDAIVIYDLNGYFIKVNRAFEKMYGWDRDEILQKRTIATIPDEYMDEAAQLGRKMRAGEPVSGYETIRMKKDGTHFHVSMSFAPVRNKKGKIVAFSGIIRDISERKKAEELLRKSDMLSVVGQLAAGVAHEIRNPLTSLKGFVQLIETEQTIKKRYIDIILSELNRINTIVNEFMFLAKPQVLTFQKRDVQKLISDVMTLIDTQAILHNVEIVTIYSSKVPEIMCEENQLKQVLINILKNSLESMDGGGKILIKVDVTDEQYIRISVIDQGCGIPDERIPKLGEPFYTTKEKGTGLGLMISHKIIRSHRGHIEIESKVSQGTEVRITLPINPEEIDDIGYKLS
ncbi:PAS domain-containing sensor histidine kinase [Caldalkalibacillus salinus]|uniref:PAS domain-containing sensor histidine kinase n=1 Tax=Caldalkalibacillus salinus TaxID=2803787 RepID=UPI001921F5EB|nr:PAS domain S-box protein [Caldalkalibacillus salinus]